MRNFIIAIVGIIILIGIGAFVFLNNSHSDGGVEKISGAEQYLDRVIQSNIPESTATESSTKKMVSDLQPEKIAENDILHPLTEGMMLHATGTVHYYGQETGGSNLDDPSIPPPEIIVYPDNEPIEGIGAVIIPDTGCIGKGLFRGDRVKVSGKITNILPARGVIYLRCEQGAQVEHIQ